MISTKFIMKVMTDPRRPETNVIYEAFSSSGRRLKTYSMTPERARMYSHHMGWEWISPAKLHSVRGEAARRAA